MEAFMNGVMVIEAGLLSCLLAVWMTWLALRGLFELLPTANRHAQPIRLQRGPQSQIRAGRPA